MKKYSKKIFNILDVLLLLALVAISLSLAFNQSIWLDESLSLRWTRTDSLKSTFGCIIPDVHPPLHYIMLRYWQIITPGTIFTAKLLMILGFATCLLCGYFFLKKYAGRASFYVFSLYIISLPFMLVKTVEIRMYSWSYGFIAMTAVALYFVLEKGKAINWTLFVVCALLSAYNHYYGLISMIFVYGTVLLYFLIKKNKKQLLNFLYACIATIIGYLPWLKIGINQLMQVNGDYWIETQGVVDYIKDIFRVNAFPHSTKIYCGILLACGIIHLYHYIKNKDVFSYWGMACYLPFIGVLIFAVVYGKLVRPIMVMRYFSIPVIMMIFGAVAACKYIPKWISAIFCAFFLVMLVFVWSESYILEYNTHTDDTLAYYEEYLGENDLLLVDTGVVKTVVMYYYPDSDVEYTEDFSFERNKNSRIFYMDGQNSFGEFSAAASEAGYTCVSSTENMGFDNVNFTIYEFVK